MIPADMCLLISSSSCKPKLSQSPASAGPLATPAPLPNSPVLSTNPKPSTTDKNPQKREKANKNVVMLILYYIPVTMLVLICASTPKVCYCRSTDDWSSKPDDWIPPVCFAWTFGNVLFMIYFLVLIIKVQPLLQMEEEKAKTAKQQAGTMWPRTTNQNRNGRDCIAMYYIILKTKQKMHASLKKKLHIN